MIEFREKKGIGMIGVVMILVISIVIFTPFYIVLNHQFLNVFPVLTDYAPSIATFNSTLSPVWSALPYFFGFAVIIWTLVMSQNPYRSLVIVGIWMVILFTYFIYVGIYMAFDEFFRSDVRDMVPAGDLLTFYDSVVLQAWSGITWVLPAFLVLFGVFLAPTYLERGAGY